MILIIFVAIGPGDKVPILRTTFVII